MVEFKALLEKYKITAVLVGIVLFIYILYLINTVYAISDMKSTTQYPPWISPCPDYWSNKGNNKCVRTQNNGMLSCANQAGVNTALNYDFSTQSANPVDFTNFSLKDKCNWANACKVYWEGINDNPCSSLS